MSGSKSSNFSPTSISLIVGLLLIIVLLLTGTFPFPPTSNTLLDDSKESVSTLPPTFDATVSKPDYCHNGPNDSYSDGAFIISAGTNVTVLGMTLEGDWFMIQGDKINPCWIKAGTLTLGSNFDLEKVLKFVTAFTLNNTPCLIYPSTGRDVQTIIPRNWRVVAYGKNNQEADWVLVIPHDSNEFCWVERPELSGFQNVYLPIEPVDIAFTSTPTPTPIPTATSTLTPTNTPTNTPTATKRPVFPTPTNTRRSNNGGNDNPTPVMPTSNQPTSISPSDTPVPPTPVPPTPVPPTPVPPTPVPPTPIPPTEIPPTPTLCWPPGHCK